MGMTGGFLAMGATSMMSAQSQAQAQRDQANFSAQQYAENAKLASVQSENTIAQGNRAAAIRGQQTKQQIGQERATAAANGGDVGFGSLADIQADTAGLGAMDQLTIKNNAWLTAWGYRVQASNNQASSAFATLSGNSQYNNTLLTGGMNAMGYGLQAYGSYKKYGSTTQSSFSVPSPSSRVNDDNIGWIGGWKNTNMVDS